MKRQPDRMTPRSMQCTGISLFDSRISRGKISSLCVFHTVRVDETSSIQPRGKRSQVGGGVSRQLEAPDGPWWNFSRISQIAANLLRWSTARNVHFFSRAQAVFLAVPRRGSFFFQSITIVSARYRFARSSWRKLIIEKPTLEELEDSPLFSSSLFS